MPRATQRAAKIAAENWFAEYEYGESDNSIVDPTYMEDEETDSMPLTKLRKELQNQAIDDVMKSNPVSSDPFLEFCNQSAELATVQEDFLPKVPMQKKCRKPLLNDLDKENRCTYSTPDSSFFDEVVAPETPTLSPIRKSKKFSHQVLNVPLQSNRVTNLVPVHEATSTEISALSFKQRKSVTKDIPSEHIFPPKQIKLIHNIMPPVSSKEKSITKGPCRRALSQKPSAPSKNDDRGTVPNQFPENELPCPETPHNTNSETTIVSVRNGGNQTPPSVDNESAEPKVTANENSTLYNELKESPEGRGILKSYKVNSRLTPSARKSLAQLLCAKMLDNNPQKRVELQWYTDTAWNIAMCFPTEEVGAWYTKGVRSVGRKKINPKGKLFDRVRNLKSKFRKEEKQAGIQGDVSDEDNPEDESNDDGNSALKDEMIAWLENNAEPWEQVVHYFSETTERRLDAYLASNSEIWQYMKQYPALERTSGHILISKDFENLYPAKANKLFTGWSTVEEKILQLAEHEANDKGFAAVLNNFKINLQSENSEQRTVNSFFLLPLLMQSPKVNTKWKLSRQEAKEGFTLHVPSPGDVSNKLSERDTKLKKFGETSQPIVLIVGDLDDNPEYYVCINRSDKYIYYRFSSILKAVDLCFKSYFILNAKYPADSLAPWLFIQQFIFNLKTAYDGNYPGPKTLAKTLGLI